MVKRHPAPALLWASLFADLATQKHKKPAGTSSGQPPTTGDQARLTFIPSTSRTLSAE